jgi:8-oxo-dGTP pyrophosphatase MutT (NUDIX family)
MPGVPHPSATVLVLRETHDGRSEQSGTTTGAGFQVFMVRRHPEAPFMGGAYVFPGGRVDIGDHGAATAAWCDGIEDARDGLADMSAADAIACRLAAVRELFEEAGVLLARPAEDVTDAADRVTHLQPARSELHAGRRTLRDLTEPAGFRVALDTLRPFAHWVTPPVEGRRFDTRFFVARMPEGQTAAHDTAENIDSAWLTPAAAIGAALNGSIVLPPPTWAVLRHLEHFAAVEAVLAWCRRQRVARCEPVMLIQNGTRVLLMPGDKLNADPEIDFVPPETRFEWRDGQWRPVQSALS